MAKAKSIGQAELRRLMQKAQTSSSSSTSLLSGLESGAGKFSHKKKKYKLSSRELQLLAEQEREAQELESDRHQRHTSQSRPLSPSNAPSAHQSVPKKSILKNSGAQSHDPSAQAYAQYRAAMATAAISNSASKFTSTESTVDATATQSVTFKRPANPAGAPDLAAAKISKIDTQAPTNGGDMISKADPSDEALPEGFFDDPVLDAKARHVEYRDPGDEEWDKFQKEITQEIQGAQDLAQEDQQEATSDRQLDEIDEQMRAWHRVAILEKKMDAIEQKRERSQSHQPMSIPPPIGNGRTDRGNSGNSGNDDDEDDEDNGESLDDIDIFDWRKKC